MGIGEQFEFEKTGRIEPEAPPMNQQRAVAWLKAHATLGSKEAEFIGGIIHGLLIENRELKEKFEQKESNEVKVCT